MPPKYDGNLAYSFSSLQLTQAGPGFVMPIVGAWGAAVAEPEKGARRPASISTVSISLISKMNLNVPSM